jgi:hypothetical protein
MDKDDNRIEIAITKGDEHIEFELATNTIEEFKDIIMSMAQVVGFDEESIEKHFNYQEVEV